MKYFKSLSGMFKGKPLFTIYRCDDNNNTHHYYSAYNRKWALIDCHNYYDFERFAKRNLKPITEEEALLRIL